MSSLKKKKPSPNPSLPDDLLLSCFARVSRLYYPTLSLVSKSFRSLLASPELYKARSLLGQTESCLYVCLQFHRFENPRWFTLCRKPDQTLTNVKVSYALATVPVPQSPLAQCSNLVAVGSNIYNIGGSTSPSSSVSILDCRSHTWHETKHIFYDKSVCFNGKLHVISNKGVASYNSKEGRWDVVGPWWDYSIFLDEHCCEIGNVLYLFLIYGPFLVWHNTEVREWIKLEGFVGLPKFPLDACVRLADYGGKMVILWDEDLPCSGPGGSSSKEMKMIWCAEIALEKHERYGIRGKVEWFDHVLTVPSEYKFVKVLSATV